MYCLVNCVQFCVSVFFSRVWVACSFARILYDVHVFKFKQCPYRIAMCSCENTVHKRDLETAVSIWELSDCWAVGVDINMQRHIRIYTHDVRNSQTISISQLLISTVPRVWFVLFVCVKYHILSMTRIVSVCIINVTLRFAFYKYHIYCST